MFSKKGGHEPEPGPGDWTLEILDRPDGSVPYEIFRASLDPYTRAALDISGEEVLAKQGHNVCASTKFGRNLKRGLYEFKIGNPLDTICNELGIPVPAQFSDGKPVLLRLFFALEGARIVLLLGGYEKKKDDSEKRQNKEIEAARALQAEHKERQKRDRGRRKIGRAEYLLFGDGLT